MKKLKWILFILVAVVVISVTVEVTFKVCDKIEAIFQWKKIDCDEVDMKDAKGFLAFFSKAGLFSLNFVTVNNFGQCVKDPLAQCGPASADAVGTARGEEQTGKKVLKNPPAMNRVVGDMLAAYERNDFSNAVRFAHIGLEMMEPVLRPYKTRTFTIDARFAYNASSVYAMIAEEAWAGRAGQGLRSDGVQVQDDRTC